MTLSELLPLNLQNDPEVPTITKTPILTQPI